MALPPHEPAFQLSNPHANTGDPFDEGCENSVTRIRWPRLNEATALSAWRSKIDSGVLAGSRRGSGEVGQGSIAHRSAGG